MNTDLRTKGVEIKTVASDKYKNNALSLNFILPMNDENIASAHVLSAVLLRGCKKYPTVKAIGRRVNMLYDPILSVRVFKTVKSLIFRVSVNFLDKKFIPDGKGDDIFSELSDVLYDILVDAFPADEELFKKYTESEKKLRLDVIRAEKNNKDAYAIAKCQQILFEGSPLGCNGKGTEKAVTAITTDTLRETLDDILNHAPVLMVYAGRCSDGTEGEISALAEKLFANRKEGEIVRPEFVRPKLEPRSFDIIEEADANQGRAVIAYKIADDLPLCKAELFNEVLGGSPVSRLFMNVRERLQLCYYCASSVMDSLGLMFVRSGIANKNRDKAINEINAQIESLCDPDNITDSEFDAAILALKISYGLVRDDAMRYADWMAFKYIEGKSCDVLKYLSAIDAFEKKDVSDVAKTVILKLSYFLKGTADGGMEIAE